MTRTFTKIFVAGLLSAMPIAAVATTACAAASPGDVPIVLPAPPPADPPGDSPEPPPPTNHGEYYNTNDSYDWSNVGDTGGGGGGG